MINLKDRKTILFFGGVILLIYLDISFILKPQIISLNKINSKIKDLHQQISLISRDILRESGMKDRLERLREEPRKTRIIFEEKISDVINEISKIANRTNTKIKKISLSKDLGVTPLLDSPMGKFYSLTISLEILAGYHQFGKFLNLLESDERFLKVEEINITSEYKIKLTLQTFFIKR